MAAATLLSPPFFPYRGTLTLISPCTTTPPRASSSSPSPKTLAEIQKSRVIACLRANDSKLALEAARAALSGGISVLEVVMSTPGVLEVVERLIEEHPSATIGVGTVLNSGDAREAIKAGAKFLLSPCMVLDILPEAERGQVLYLPGVMTPTEVLCACNAGARVIKVYPVSMLGGEKYISMLKKPFPHVPMVASQGISIDSVEKYIKVGALAVVLSDAIFDREAMQQKNFDTIQRLAQLAALQGCRAENS